MRKVTKVNEYQVLANLSWHVLRNRLRDFHKHSRLKIAFCTTMLLAMGLGALAFFSVCFHFLHSFSVVGPFLADRFLYVFTYCIFILLLTSSIVTTYMVLYKSEDNRILLILPISWEALWTKKFIEIYTLSAWALLALVIPFVISYGFFKKADLFFYLLAPIYYAAMSGVACAFGTFATILFFFVFRQARLRQWILWLIITAVLLSLLKLRYSPVVSQYLSPADIFNRLLPQFKLSFYPLLPHYWTSEALAALIGHHIQEQAFYGFLLVINGLLFFQIGFLTARTFYRRSWIYLTESRLYRRKQTQAPKFAFRLKLPGVSTARQALILKDIRLFLREPIQWSQFLIFFGVLAIYFANLRTLEYDLLIPFWKHFIFVLNVAALMMTLAGLNGRFVFPLFSLEGNRFWIVGLSPLGMKSVLMEKFRLWFVINLAIIWTMTLIAAMMLRVSGIMVFVMLIFTGLACYALTGLSISLGAIFPDFKTDNPIKIVSGFSGTLNFILEFIYVLAVIAGLGLMIQSGESFASFLHFIRNGRGTWLLAAMGALNFLYMVVPLEIAKRRLKKLEY